MYLHVPQNIQLLWKKKKEKENITCLLLQSALP